MKERNISLMLRKVGAVISNDHIVYTSGRHGSAYVNKDAVYPHTEVTSSLCYEMANRFALDDIEVVIAPAVGAVILSQWVAYHLSRIRKTEVLGVYADKIGEGSFIIKRGYNNLVIGKRTLVVEDIVTTGGSAKRVIDAVREIDGIVVGLGVLCNRGGVTKSDLSNIPKFEALVNLDLESWDAADCPLCKQGVPVNIQLGKGLEFMRSKGL